MKPIFLIAWLASLTATAWLSLRPQPEFPAGFQHADKLYHFLGYAWLGLLGILSFPSKRGRLAVVGLTIFFGIGIELLQGLVPGRMPSVADGLANAAGVGLAWMVQRIGKGRK